MRLTLVNSDLGGGGGERVLSLLANCWADRGHQVTVVTLSPDEPFFALNAAVRCRSIGSVSGSANPIQAIFANTRRIAKLRRAILDCRPDVVISFVIFTNIRVLAAVAGTGIPVVICERTDPRQFEVSPAWRALRRLLYPRAAALICQTPNMVSFFEPLVQGTIQVIPNPVVVPSPREAAHLALPQGKRLVAMGRLHPVKNFDLLIDVFARLSPRHPDWQLLIVGEGPLRGELQSQIARLSLESRVHLLGLLPDPFPVLRASDLFVLTSSREGFPNALCEAMACGLPAVSFDCASGPGYIIRDGVDGVLVPPGNQGALAHSMHQLMSDPARRARLAQSAPEVTERFSLDTVMSRWNDTLSSVLKSNG